MTKKLLMYSLALVLSSVGAVTFAKQMGFSPQSYPQIAERLEMVAEKVANYDESDQEEFVDRVEMLIQQHSQRKFIMQALEYLLDQLEMMMADKNLVEIAVESNSFPTLVAALESANLVDALQADGPYTVFAPTEEAFDDLLEMLDMTAEELLADRDLLTTVLLYHIVEGKFVANDVLSLPQGTQVETLQGETIIIDNRNGVEINNVDVVQTNIVGSNGVIHVIDEVLLPPTVLESLGMDTMRGSQDIVTLADESGMFPTLVAAVKAAGLVDDLQAKGPFTVYAPTEEAFADLLEMLDMTANELLADTDLLLSVLSYHVVPGRYTAQDLLQIDGMVISPSLNGKELIITNDDDELMINDANIIDSDYFATNGVVHVIDTVLVP